MAARIEFAVGPGVSAAVLAITREVWVSPEFSLDVRSGEGMDADLQEAIAEEQMAAFEHERELVENLLGQAQFEKGPVVLDEAAAERLLQAAAGIRLALRNGKLGFLSDEVLESGGWQPGKLPPPMRAILGVYLFWAALQEAVVHALDESIHSSLQEDELDGD
ncbi:MAG: hypothetical protein JJT96_00320 [Opitutales bacterium]|nr:hypothetical protein [Opitutales bacterium]